MRRRSVRARVSHGSITSPSSSGSSLSPPPPSSSRSGASKFRRPVAPPAVAPSTSTSAVHRLPAVLVQLVAALSNYKTVALALRRLNRHWSTATAQVPALRDSWPHSLQVRWRRDGLASFKSQLTLAGPRLTRVDFTDAEPLPWTAMREICLAIGCGGARPKFQRVEFRLATCAFDGTSTPIKPLEAMLKRLVRAVHPPSCIVQHALALTADKTDQGDDEEQKTEAEDAVKPMVLPSPPPPSAPLRLLPFPLPFPLPLPTPLPTPPPHLEISLHVTDNDMDPYAPKCWHRMTSALGFPLCDRFAIHRQQDAFGVEFRATGVIRNWPMPQRGRNGQRSIPAGGGEPRRSSTTCLTITLHGRGVGL